jgi:hypothetical protein
MTEKEMRELDAWIFEQVIGGAVALCSKYCPTCRESKVSDTGKCLQCGSNLHWDFPHYTTEPAAAMMVLEKCAECAVLNGHFKLPVSIMRRGDLKWVVSENCEDVDLENDRHIVVVEADTLPHAIALFARQLFSKQRTL